MDYTVEYVLEHEGITVNVEKSDKKPITLAEVFRAIRMRTNMNRKEFAEWLGVPYRTMQDWELGKSQVPEYLLRLVAYKVENEIGKGNL